MMANTSILSHPYEYLTSHPFSFALICVVAWLLWNKLQPGLVGIPGPTAAAYTKVFITLVDDN